MPAIAAIRVKVQARWVPGIWARMGQFAARNGISRNSAMNMLVEEALDARDLRRSYVSERLEKEDVLTIHS